MEIAMFGNNLLPMLLLLLLSNNCNTDDGTNGCNKSTLAMCLCLLCLFDCDDSCTIT